MTELAVRPGRCGREGREQGRTRQREESGDSGLNLHSASTRAYRLLSKLPEANPAGSPYLHTNKSATSDFGHSRGHNGEKSCVKARRVGKKGGWGRTALKTGCRSRCRTCPSAAAYQSCRDQRVGILALSIARGSVCSAVPPMLTPKQLHRQPQSCSRPR